MHVMEKQMNTVYNDLTEIGAKEGFDPKMLQAQIFLETGYLKHMLPESNNLFNIKWKGNEEEIMQRLNIEIRKKTYYVWEIINGKKIYLYQDFRVYQTILDSIVDYIDYVKHKTDMDIYKRFGFKPREYYQQLKDFGYQTDPDYVNKLMKVYDLVSYVWFNRMDLIKMLQKLVGQEVDGYLGPNTMQMIEKFKINKS